MKMSKSDDQMLDDLFALAQAKPVMPSDDLMARILADADAVQVAAPAPTQSIWADFFDIIGGWPSVGGLAMAGVTGVWFGIAPPATVTTFAADLIGTDVTVDLLADSSSYFAETLTDG